MKKILLALSFITAAAASASAQDMIWAHPLASDSSPEPVWQDPPHRMYLAGVRVGFVEAADSDDAGFTFGLYGRFFGVPRLGFDASIEWHEMDFEDGDASVSQVPILFGVVLEPMEGQEIAPYVVAGIGAVWTDVEFSGALAGASDKDDVLFAAYAGLGIQWTPRKGVGVTFEARYVAVSESGLDSSAFDDDMDYVQITVGFHAEY